MLFNLPDWLRYEIKERWERIEIRKWINNNPRIVLSITFASVLALLVTIGLSIPKRSTPIVKEYKKGWFYDTNSGQLFVAKSKDYSSINADSNAVHPERQTIVRAYVFSYSNEPNEANQFIGFLEMPDPAAGKEDQGPKNSGTGGAKKWGNGKLIRRVDDEQWVPANSNEGQYILSVLFKPNENGEIAHYCLPE